MKGSESHSLASLSIRGLPLASPEETGPRGGTEFLLALYISAAGIGELLLVLCLWNSIACICSYQICVRQIQTLSK